MTEERLTENEIHARDWWCPHCLQSVPPEMVTKDGEHYLESGGCGWPVRGEIKDDDTPCHICGIPESKHGSAPTCAGHAYTPDGLCRTACRWDGKNITFHKCHGSDECKTKGCAFLLPLGRPRASLPITPLPG